MDVMKGTTHCNDCGKYMVLAGGASVARMYDFAAMELSHDHFRCNRCTPVIGPARSNARPADGDMTPYEIAYP